MINDADVLFQYIVEGCTQEEIAATSGLHQREVSNIIRKYGFNTVHNGAWNSGRDRGKYRSYKGMKVTIEMVSEFVRRNANDFEPFLDVYYQQYISKRQIEEKERRQAALYERQRLEEERLRKQRLEEAERVRREQEQRRLEEKHRRQEEERRWREMQRREEEERQRKRQVQIAQNLHIKWMNRAIQYCETGNYEEAQRYAKASHDLMSMNGNVYTIALACYHLKNYEQAYHAIDNLTDQGDYKPLDCRILRANIFYQSKWGSLSKFFADVEYILINSSGNFDYLLERYAEQAVLHPHLANVNSASELLQTCLHKRIAVVQANLALSSIFYRQRMWKQAIDYYKAAEAVCSNMKETELCYSLYLEKGISYYHLGDLDSAYVCLRYGFPHNRLLNEEEKAIFFDCLKQAGDKDSMKYFKNELNFCKKELGLPTDHLIDKIKNWFR